MPGYKLCSISLQTVNKYLKKMHIISKSNLNSGDYKRFHYNESCFNYLSTINKFKKIINMNLRVEFLLTSLLITIQFISLFHTYHHDGLKRDYI